ncbi:MAG: aldehyde dehydrogenase family protein [Deltaproteobacteria bacterium]|nr:MAG: aldehyde dehydrogenase family protein [Deltaproteobacteria bacterium]
MRTTVEKTLKMYVGGKFIRSESGRVLPATSAKGRPMNVAAASRKDLRDAIQIARGAQKSWAGRSAYNRGQIFYRLAEILEDRVDAMPTSGADVLAATDRAVHFAGWTDKITALLSSLNPVAHTYVNYSMIGPMGVVFAAPDPADGLTGMVEAMLGALLMGNSVVLMVPTASAELAVALSEALAVSDFPGGCINVLTGDVDSVVKVAIRHDDLDALYLLGDAVSADLLEEIGTENARVMRRLVLAPRSARPAPPSRLAKLAEVKTVWMSSALMSGGGAAY